MSMHNKYMLGSGVPVLKIGMLNKLNSISYFSAKFIKMPLAIKMLDFLGPPSSIFNASRLYVNSIYIYVVCSKEEK